MKLYAHEHTRKSDGEKFIAYSARGKNGKWYNVKFTDNVKDKILEHDGEIIDQIIVAKDDIYIPSDAKFPTLIITYCKDIIFKENGVLPF